VTDRTRATLSAVIAAGALGVAVAGGAISNGASWVLVAHVVALTIPAAGLAGLSAFTLWSPYEL
jgi:ABC-type proline/glycine betaine transport system permease subunit